MSFFKPKKIRKRIVSLVQSSQKPGKSIQEYHDNLSTIWFDGQSALWNYTINPAPSMTCGTNMSWGKIKPLSARNKIVKVIKNIFTRYKNKQLLMLEEIALYFEFGDKKGKFHCNLCTKWHPTVSTATRWGILNHLREEFGNNQYSVIVKDHRECMKRPDSYNMKDAAVMDGLGFGPKHYVAEPIFPYYPYILGKKPTIKTEVVPLDLSLL